MSGDVDYADTRLANENREKKAHALAEFCWVRAIGPGDVEAMPQATRNRMARVVGVNPPSRTGGTWARVVVLLADMAAWQSRNPWHEAAWQKNTRSRGEWVPAGVVDDTPEIPKSRPDVDSN